jgi:tetratricopeptide (TPR) repeat protein
MRSWCANALIAPVALLALAAPRGARCEEADPLAAVEEDVVALRLEAARKQLDGLPADFRSSPRAKFVEGKLLFFEGDAKASLEALRAAIQEQRTQLDWKQLRDRVEGFTELTARFTSREGASGRFVYRFEAPEDALLVPYADRALATQMDALGAAFGDRPTFRVEVLFVADTRTLAALSGLLVEQIERTGTVGVSKNGRIILLTPRALASGYPWLDTLGHELAHLFITRASRDKAPIWLHEGAAKLLEGSWRGAKGGELMPEEAYLLDRAAREHRLIPLRRFHPSIAALPDQEDAALAYAQVLSLVRYLDAKIGAAAGGTEKLLSLLGEGQSIDGALVALTKFNLRRLYLWWEQEVSGRRQTPVSVVVLMQKRFKHGAAAEEAPLDGELTEEAQRHVRLGDLLRLRGHAGSAVAEYRSAQEIEGANVPRIVERLGGSLIDLRRYADATSLLEPVVALYPSYTAGFAQLGEALAQEDKCDGAIPALERAIALNPFDPTPHCLLERCYGARGKKDAVALENDQCLKLSAAKPKEQDPTPAP